RIFDDGGRNMAFHWPSGTHPDVAGNSHGQPEVGPGLQSPGRRGGPTSADHGKIDARSSSRNLQRGRERVMGKMDHTGASDPGGDGGGGRDSDVRQTQLPGSESGEFAGAGESGGEDRRTEVPRPVRMGSTTSSPDESVKDNTAPVQIVRLSLPKETRELIIAIVMAASVITNFVLWGKLHDADKDIQTQVWLRDDALTKFQQGPFADLKAHVIALENC